MLAFLLPASCTKSNLFYPDRNPDEGLEHEMIVLGKQLEDPYTVANMSKAFESVYGTKADRGQITTTDFYVRFLPRDEAQMDELLSMGLQLIDHPVDYEILREGDYYHDPQLGEEDITWQYAVVSKGFVFPSGIKYEILDECFLPENSSTKAEYVDWDSVEREAFRLTGNAGMLRDGTKADTGRPSGRVTIEDDSSGKVVGVKGVKVSCNVFVKIASSFTDEEGYYEMNMSFSSEPRYRLVFKNRKGFCIGFNLVLVPASVSTLGKGGVNGMDVHVDGNSDRKLYTRCVVNNAGYEYYCSCNNEGIVMKTPPSNLRIWLFQRLSISSAVMLHQGALIDNSVVAKYLGEYSFLVKMFLPDITMGLRDMDSFSDIYSEAVHQFAHASHFMQAGKDYWDKYIYNVLLSFVTSGFVTFGSGTEDNHGYIEVAEMWAYYMQNRLHEDRFGGNPDFGSSYWFSPQILMVLDNKGMDRFKIFSALGSDITDRDLFQAKLVSLYPESRSMINQAFGRYN